MGGSDPAQAAGAMRLGSYEVMRLLARGGMAELFLAQSIGPEGFAKLVVLKKILPAFASSPRFVRSFLDEARLAATLDHPHIAHVYDMGTVGGDYFFTMEYVHGQDVRSLMRRAEEKTLRMPIELCVLIASTVAGALHYAHEQRGPDGTSLAIVHRDVSPSNILISYDGTVKLVDFGVAKAANSSEKTRTGSIKGKIAYMSPEQASGNPIDRRSDIFSLGIVMWEMVTGARLFKAENDLITIQKIVNGTPPLPTQHRPDCPPELERIIMRALAKSADDRYQTAEALQVELEELAREAKLAQSSVALRAHMYNLFAVELAAWQAAQATGTTLAQHVTMHPELTTPLRGSDVYSLDEDDELQQRTSAVIPKVLRPDGTPVPIMQWNAQHPAPPPTGSVHTQPPTSRRALWIAVGAAISAAALMAIIAGGRNKPSATNDTVRMQAEPTAPPVAAPPSVPAPPPAETAPPPAESAPPSAEPAPAALATQPPVDETPPPAEPPPKTTAKTKPTRAPARPPRKVIKAAAKPPATKPPATPEKSPETPVTPKPPPPPTFDPNDPLPPRR